MPPADPWRRLLRGRGSGDEYPRGICRRRSGDDGEEGGLSIGAYAI